MAEKKKRVHHLAKELLVKSSTIIEKCRAESIEIKNHMHVVSAGLEATIREWFSEGAHTTTLEESRRVDLTVVRVKPKRAKKTKIEVIAEALPEAEEKTTKQTETPRRKSPTQVAAEAAGETATAVLEPTEIAHPVEGVPTLPDQAEKAVAEQMPPAAAAVAPLGPPEAGDEAPPSIAASAPQAPPVEPPKPTIAGPQNVPEPAKLAGPKVVRFDKPEVVERPRPARPAAHRPDIGRVGTKGPKEESDEASSRGRGRAPAGPRFRGTTPDAGTAAGKRAHPRRGIRDTRDVVNEKLREWRDRDLIERRERLSHVSGRGIGGLKAIEGKQGLRRSGQRGPQVHVRKDKVEMSEPILIRDLSREAGIAWMEIQKRLIQEGILAGINSTIESDKAQLIALDYGIELIIKKAKSRLDKLAEKFEAMERKDLEPRPPVVTVLGHVDHGKTSLLDRIRKTSVVEGEAGGITQHIGASRVKVGDKWVTFLDTPGHAAFTAMRARGANMTDVVVLVVAADDGVMPTTVEAINHAKAAGATVVVALNKIDLPHEIDKIYGQLTEHGLTPSGDWGGDTDVIKTSAVTGEGITELLEHLATLSEVMELQADPTLPATGTVIEAERSGVKGAVARVLVQEGSLRTGDVIVCGVGHGRVRALRDATGKALKCAGPSTPVEVTGLSEVPSAGDRFFVLDNARLAKEIAEEMAALQREAELVQLATPTSLESMLAGVSEGEIPELNVIIRADVQGSVDVLKKTLSDFPSDQVRLNVIHAGVGSVTESDVVLAQASQAVILAFHVVPEPAIVKLADDARVDIRGYRVIYNLTDDIRKALEGLLEPDEKIESRGRAEVREVFSISRVGKIAGCYVRDGVISRSHMIRILRDSVLVKDNGEIASLKRFKDDAKEVKNGFECGIRIEAFDDLKPGDIIESFEVVKIAKTLDV